MSVTCLTAIGRAITTQVRAKIQAAVATAAAVEGETGGGGSLPTSGNRDYDEALNRLVQHKLNSTSVSSKKKAQTLANKKASEVLMGSSLTRTAMVKHMGDETDGKTDNDDDVQDTDDNDDDDRSASRGRGRSEGSRKRRSTGGGIGGVVSALAAAGEASATARAASEQASASTKAKAVIAAAEMKSKAASSAVAAQMAAQTHAADVMLAESREKRAHDAEQARLDRV